MKVGLIWTFMNVKCQRSMSFSDLGWRSLGLNVHQNFKHLLRNHRANLIQILYRIFMPHENKSLFCSREEKMFYITWCSWRAFIQIGSMPIYGKILQESSSPEPYVRWPWNLEESKRGLSHYINDDPGLTLTYFTKSNLALRCLNGKKVKQSIFPKQL